MAKIGIIKISEELFMNVIELKEVYKYITPIHIEHLPIDRVYQILCYSDLFEEIKLIEAILYPKYSLDLENLEATRIK